MESTRRGRRRFDLLDGVLLSTCVQGADGAQTKRRQIGRVKSCAFFAFLALIFFGRCATEIGDYKSALGVRVGITKKSHL